MLNKKKLCEDEVRYRVSLYVKKPFNKKSVADFFISCRRSIDNETPTICKNLNLLRNTDSMRFNTIMSFVCSPYFRFIKVSKELNDEWEPEPLDGSNELYEICRPKIPEELYNTNGGTIEINLIPVIKYLVSLSAMLSLQ